VGWIVAGLLVVFGIALIAAGSSGSANALFEAVTGIDVPGTKATTSTTSGGSAPTAPPTVQGTVGQTSGVQGVAA
jgi:hypothetical protein